MAFVNKKGKPAWLKQRLPRGGEYEKVRQLIARSNLKTVCQAARCPNIWECFSKGTATFMILGDRCSRNCRFCNIPHGKQLDPPDPGEPFRVAQAAQDLGLKYVVVTSVTRDDLNDGGAGHFAMTIDEIKKRLPDNTRPENIRSKNIRQENIRQENIRQENIRQENIRPENIRPENIRPENIRVEVLIPDFKGDTAALERVINAGPDVLNHNVETVPSLYYKARPEADYHQSLNLLDRASKSNVPVKSGIMAGLGETMDELKQTIRDLHAHGCTLLTIGQYLQPSLKHLPVEKYYTPEEFEMLKSFAKKTGFTGIASGPFVRSSYQADKLFSNKRP
ncbi:MAG: lipoyl synthase [Thermodesulfobacteriota bacterium]|nr:lipoyl synthase [Thermodesulfobacteriota bacterium]